MYMKTIILHIKCVFVYRFGPLICHWTMRFEAKNKYIKGLAVRMGNFINAPYTLAVRHQQLQCYYNLNQEIIGYSVHFHAYVITSHSPKEYKLVKINDLFSPFPLHPRTVSTLTSSGQYAVVLKHGLCTL